MSDHTHTPRFDDPGAVYLHTDAERIMLQLARMAQFYGPPPATTNAHGTVTRHHDKRPTGC